MPEVKPNGLKGAKVKHRTVELYRTQRGLVIVCWDGFIRPTDYQINGFEYQSYSNSECNLHVFYSRYLPLEFVTEFVKKNKEWLVNGVKDEY